ncbi:gluconokinase [Microbacterium sp. NPDC089189]|uniref:gluconokinase n=1 Tax=Microbacterium sp. NPDC089189 TaxID=3154972 RepID=UPI003414CF6C
MTATRPAAPRLIVMGVSGVGKSTVASALAAALGVGFLDADDLHTAEAVQKMAAGDALTDADRLPWLTACGVALAAVPGGAVLACSALARRYRALLRDGAPTARFVELAADPDVVMARATAREGHFMPPALVASQFATWEPLGADEPGVSVDAHRRVDEIVADVLSRL